ncbi:MAG TPA: metallophosphoesterase [Bryobacteraceae bacterium]|nr:metallophosphoesterase [Bryobacteraceae bacterium]
MNKTLIALLLSGAAGTLIAQTEQVVGGPYVVQAGPRSATLMWVVETGRVAVGADPAKLDKTAPILSSRQVVLSGLKPGSTYYYQSFPGEAGKGSFKTAPTAAGNFEFVVYGDTRTRHDVHRTVVQGILKYAHPDFILHTGDLVEDGADSSLWPIFFSAERELLRKAAFYPTPGNHERNSGEYYELMSAKPYYSFDWGQAHFSLIDSDLPNAAPTEFEREAFWREQTQWLENDLKNSQNAAFRFVAAHHPPMTAVARRQGQNAHMTALEPLFEKYKVTAGLFGHDHNYQHYLLRGVHYFISGGGGAPLYDVDTPPAGITQKVESTENFLIVKVAAGKATVEAVKPSGERIDWAELGP